MLHKETNRIREDDRHNMKATFKYILRSDWKNSNGEHPVLARITAKRRHAYIDTGIKIKKSDWNDNKKRVRPSNPRHAQLNALLDRLSGRFAEVHTELFMSSSTLSPQEIKVKVLGHNSTLFFTYARDQADRVRRLGKYNTHKKWESSLNILQEFFSDVKRNPNPTFADFDREVIKAYAE